MPGTMEVVCRNEGCELDMLELHFTYDMPDGTSAADFVCPYCEDGESLEALQV